MQKSISTISRMESCTDAGSKNATEWEKMIGWVSSAMCSTSSDAANIGAKNRARMYAAFETYGCNATLFEELEASYDYLRTTTDEEVYCNVSLRPDVTAIVEGVAYPLENADCDAARVLFTVACSMEPTICASDETNDEEPVSELQRMKDDYASYQCSATANEKVQPYLVTPLPDVTAPGVSECLSEYAAAAAPVAPAARPPALVDPAALEALTHSGGPPPVLAGTCASPSTSARGCPRFCRT